MTNLELSHVFLESLHSLGLLGSLKKSSAIYAIIWNHALFIVVIVAFGAVVAITAIAVTPVDTNQISLKAGFHIIIIIIISCSCEF